MGIKSLRAIWYGRQLGREDLKPGAQVVRPRRGPKGRKGYDDPRVDHIVATQHAHKRLGHRKGIER